MEQLVALCKRRGLLFQSSEIYGGLQGFWDYGPMGLELKRNVREAWWRDMVTAHNELEPPPGAPSAYEMVGLDCAIVMHPQVWKCSGHYDLFHDLMIDCRESKRRYRYDQIQGRWVEAKGQTIFVATEAQGPEAPDDLQHKALRFFNLRNKEADELQWQGPVVSLTTLDSRGQTADSRGQTADSRGQTADSRGQTADSRGQTADSRGQTADSRGQTAPGEPEKLYDFSRVLAPDAKTLGTLTAPREFNLMFKTIVGALGGEEDAAFLRPETAQGIFVNFKNVLDSTRVRVPFGVAQLGKSFRNEITPRNFTFRSREFEQMEIEFFCHPGQSRAWYQYWRDRRYRWYTDLGLAGQRLRLRDHSPEELSHYSCGTADIEYAFPFLAAGDFGELEGVAHRGDFDLRSHMEGKLVRQGDALVVEQDAQGKPKYRGSGKDLSYFDDLTKERFLPHVIEPSAGADRATLAFLCEAYCEDEVPDESGKPTKRLFLRLHPRLAPIKAAVFPLVKKDGMPEVAKAIYASLKPHCNVFYDEKGAVGRRYRRQDEVGTPFCITVDGQTLSDGTVTIRDRDTLRQWRVKKEDCPAEIRQRLGL
jgi:glycyl-tRNA synthetase